MAQSLFRLLLGQLAVSIAADGGARRSDRWPGVHRLFRRDPLLAGATAAQLARVAMPSPPRCRSRPGRSSSTSTRLRPRTRFSRAKFAWNRRIRPRFWCRPGTTFGVADTLAGTPSGWRAVATADGRALRLDRDDLFGVMADHVDLMQNLFTEALRLRDQESSQAVAQPGHPVFRVESGSSARLREGRSMDRFRRAPIIVAGRRDSVSRRSSLAGQSATRPHVRSLSPSEMETFLLKARILDIKDAGGGVTGSQRVKLSDGTLTHDAHVQSVDISKPVFEAGQHTELNFKDTYRFNIAGYRLARLLRDRHRPDVGRAQRQRQDGRRHVVGRRRPDGRERSGSRKRRWGPTRCARPIRFR